MKHYWFFQLAIICLFISACKKDATNESSVKKLPSFIKGNIPGIIDETRFYYDDQNRIKCYAYHYKQQNSIDNDDSILLFYNGEGQIFKENHYDKNNAFTIFYSYNKDTISETHLGNVTGRDNKYIINSKNQIIFFKPINSEEQKYYYDNIGNTTLIEFSHSICNGICYNEKYSFDNKHGIYSSMQMPSWWQTRNLTIGFFYFTSINNCTEVQTKYYIGPPPTEHLTKFNYTYDQDGYPLTIKDNKGEVDYTITFIPAK